MSYTAPRHLESLQVLRGIAASLVVMVHAINVIDLAPKGWHRGWLNTAASLNEFGATGVDLFFVISGFVMAFTMGRFNGLSGARRFAARRFWRVVPPFWFACLLFIPFSRMIVSHLPAASYVNAVTFVPVWHSHPYSPPPLAIGWTLAFELVFYAIVSTVIASRVTTGRRVYVLAIVTIFAGVGSLWPRSIIFNPMMAEFGLGVVVYMVWRRGISRFFHCTALSTGAAALLASAIFGWIFDARLEMAVAGVGGDMRVICWGVPWALVVLGAADVAISRKVVYSAGIPTNKANMLPASQPQIDEVATLLGKEPTLKLAINGYTDDTGSSAHNRSLSEARAMSVVAALVARVIAPDRLQAKGFGDSHPVADNDTDKGKAKNRRAELVRL